MKTAYTEKGAVQYTSTYNANLDLFSCIGSIREVDFEKQNQFERAFENALREDQKSALSIMFWTRAVRLGAGRRDVFYKLFLNTYEKFPIFIKDNIRVISELGYFGDYEKIFNMTDIEDLKKLIVSTYINQLSAKNALAFKWAPRKGAFAKAIRASLDTTNKNYRLFIAQNSTTLEKQMTQKEWSEINYEKAPSRAFNKYKNAFARHDMERLVQVVSDPNSKLKVGGVWPHEILKDLFTNVHKMNEFKSLIIKNQWAQIPNYIKSGERILPLVDTSGSMKDVKILGSTALHIAVSLGLYCAERNEGQFKNRFINFDDCPRLHDFSKCKDVIEKYQQVRNAEWGGTTDFEAAYMQILDYAKMYNVPQECMPTMLLVLSDMQFDVAGGYRSHNYRYDDYRRNTPHFENIKAKFEEVGYAMPMMVFWNLSEANTGTPATKYDNVALVSGFSPKIMEAILQGVKIEETISENGEKNITKTINPMDVMHNAIKPIYDILNFDSINDI